MSGTYRLQKKKVLHGIEPIDSILWMIVECLDIYILPIYCQIEIMQMIFTHFYQSISPARYGGNRSRFR